MKLTDRLVKRAARAGPAAGARKRGPAAGTDPSRDRLFAAAATAFAAHGFAGTSVDRIADAAHLNKAMIYYHFGSKAGLYREILRDMFGAVGARARAVAASGLPPADKIRAFVDTFAAEAQARPHFPPIWFREVADGGARLDDATLVDMTGVLKALAAIIEEGVRARDVPAGQPLAPPRRHRRARPPVLCVRRHPPARRAVGRARRRDGGPGRSGGARAARRAGVARGKTSGTDTGMSTGRHWRVAILLFAGVMSGAVACRNGEAPVPRASGYVEATEVRVSPEVGGRVVELEVNEGDRLDVGSLIARLSTTDAELSIKRAEADRAQAMAQLALLEAGARPEEIRQAQAQLDSAESDVRAATAELQSAEADLQRFEALLAANAGSRKQRDDALTRRDVAVARVAAGRDRARAAAEALARVRVGGAQGGGRRRARAHRRCRRPDRLAREERDRRACSPRQSPGW